MTTINRKHLLESIRDIKPFISSRGSLPILQCVKLWAKNGVLNMGATDLELSATVTLDAEWEYPDVCVPLKRFEELIKLTEDTTILLAAGEGELDINAEFTMPTEPAEDMPIMAGDEIPTPCAALNGSELLEQLNKVVPFASKEETRPILTGVLAELSDHGRLELVATDSYRLRVRYERYETSYEHRPVIIPAAALKQVMRLAKGKTPVFWHVGFDHFVSHSGDI